MSFSTYKELSAQIKNEESEKSFILAFKNIHNEYCSDRLRTELTNSGIITGRMSSKQPNISNLPRSK